MKKDLDACLAAGMNDYITKPIDRAALASTLRKWLPESARLTAAELAAASAASTPSTSSTPSTPSTPSLDGLNVTGALARLGIGFEALRRMLIRFADGQARTLADARRGRGRGRRRRGRASRARHRRSGGQPRGRHAAGGREGARDGRPRRRARPGRPRAAGAGTGRGGVPLDRQPAHTRKPGSWRHTRGRRHTASPEAPRLRRSMGPRSAGPCSRSTKPFPAATRMPPKRPWRRSAACSCPRPLAPP